MTGQLVIMGSGDTAPTMVEVHRAAMRRAGPGPAILVDTPGLRELQVWEGDLDSAFADIAELAALCRFNDCAHSTEPDCAVREALEGGTLDPDRWRNYVKLQRELRSIEARSNRRIRRELKSRWRSRAREVRSARRYGWKP